MTDCEQQLMEARQHLEEMQEAVRGLITRPLGLGVIVAGPEEYGPEILMYRVNMGGREVLVPTTAAAAKNNGFEIEDLVAGVEVSVLAEGQGGIYRVIGDRLKKVNRLPELNLCAWSDIGGLGSQIETIRDAIETPLKNPRLLKSYGFSPMKGVLLYGPPGCGKTMIAKAVARSVLNGNDSEGFVYVKGPELLNMYVGQTESMIRVLFSRARRYEAEKGRRAVIFIDEAEAIMPARGSRRSSDVDTTTVPMFLAEMDGFEKGAPFVILATNMPHALDEAVVREGRIDVHVEIPRPDESGVREIFGLHLGKTRTAEAVDALVDVGAQAVFEEFDLARVVSGAMIETIVKGAVQKALTRDMRASKRVATGVTREDLREGINLVTKSREGMRVYAGA